MKELGVGEFIRGSGKYDCLVGKELRLKVFRLVINERKIELR